MPGIFISHATRDQELVEAVVEFLLLGSGVSGDQIFYSSGAGTGVPAGARFNSYIRSRVEDSSLIVAIISPSFQESAFSTAEVGAAWVLEENFFPLMVPGYSHHELEGVLVGVQVPPLNSAEALAELHDRVCDALGLEKKTARWMSQQAKFLARLGDLVDRLEGPIKVKYEELQRVESERDGAQAALTESEVEKLELARRFEDLRRAKTREEAAAISVSDDEEALFKELRVRARDALGELPRVVRAAISFDIRSDEMPIPSRWDDEYGADEVAEALRSGHLYKGSGETVLPDSDIRSVEEALAAVGALQDFFMESSEEFDANFKERYGAPPDLKKGLVWEALLEGRG